MRITIVLTHPDTGLSFFAEAEVPDDIRETSLRLEDVSKTASEEWGPWHNPTPYWVLVQFEGGTQTVETDSDIREFSDGELVLFADLRSAKALPSGAESGHRSRVNSDLTLHRWSVLPGIRFTA